MKASRCEKSVGELGVLYHAQAVSLRRILRAKFVGSARGAGNGVAIEPTLSVQDVDDLIQDVFVRVLASLDRGQLDKVRESIPYLLTVARNLVVDSLRRRRRRAPVESCFQSSDAAQIERADLEDRDFYEHCVEAMAAYVAGLPPELSAAFDARFIQGMSQRDAAIALGVTRRRVRTLEERLVGGAARQLSLVAPSADAVCSSFRARQGPAQPAGPASYSAADPSTRARLRPCSRRARSPA